MLTLPIKKVWYEMILSGFKKEEYRNITPYYEARFKNAFGYILYNNEIVYKKEALIKFRNGYSKNAPSFIAKCSINIGEGRQEWGAIPGVKYFILGIVKILEKEEINIIE